MQSPDEAAPPAGNDATTPAAGGVSMYLVCCTQVICNELRQGLSQRQIAVTYALAMRSHAAGADRPDWRTINQAILARWRPSALERIKKMAWDLAEGRKSVEQILRIKP